MIETVSALQRHAEDTGLFKRAVQPVVSYGDNLDYGYKHRLHLAQFRLNYILVNQSTPLVWTEIHDYINNTPTVGWIAIKLFAVFHVPIRINHIFLVLL